MPTTTKSMYATKNGTSYMIKFRYGSEFMVVEFNELGINKIIHPKRLYKQTAADLNADFSNLTLWNEIRTDWVSPYRGVTAINGGTSSFTGTVGGNHGTVRGEGFATARSISMVMYADGNIINDGTVVNCDEVKIVTQNYISASNKMNPDTGEKADSLEEVVTFSVTPNHIEVSVSLTALEDLMINGYVGLQMTTNMFAGEVYFNDGSGKFKPDGTRRDSMSQPFNGDRVVYSDSDNVFVVYTNRTSGLGDLSQKGAAPIHFISAFNKIYSHLISSPITVLANEPVCYSGGYTLDVPMSCAGAEKAYTIQLNGTKYYCVDFLEPVSDTYLQVNPLWLGKQIDLVEKSESVICDDIISEKGLRISSSDWGSLKFRMKE